MLNGTRHIRRGAPGAGSWTGLIMTALLLGTAAAKGDNAAAQTPLPIAQEQPAGTPPVAPVTSDSVSRPPATHNLRRHYTAGEIIDANVHRLAHGLELDAGQQARLRSILLNHYQQLTRLRTQAVPGMDRSAAMKGIIDRTRSQIRSILTDTQKQKYPSEVSPELTGPTRADLEHWLDLRDAAAAQTPESAVKEN
jgi:hypothetical protein